MFDEYLKRRDFLKYVIGSLGMASLDWNTLPFLTQQARAGGAHPSTVILGIDGMDPALLTEFVRKGVMPTFQKLIRDGSFRPLGSSIPPQSPVAWSNFITGRDPGTHGIFDFIHRDPATYLPVFSLSRVEEPSKVLHMGEWDIPLSRGRAILLRQGKAFWQTLCENDVPCTVFKIPSNFPPVKCKGRTLSGLGTPDLLGTYGSFSFFTDDPEYAELDVSGGKVYKVDVKDSVVTTALTGPENTLKKDKANLTVPITVDVDTKSQAVKVALDKDEFILKVGEWSDWKEVHFKAIGPITAAAGICRFYLKALEPHFMLYASPVNIDPGDPALPISTPGDYSREICDKVGPFYTQGMAEDTKALEWGVFTDAEYIEQAAFVLDERKKLLDIVLDQYRGGLMFFYISTLDLCQHMLWRNMDPNHPMHTEDAARYRNRIEELYVEMDHVVAGVIDRIPRDTTLMIMSDHGFSPYYRKFNLNTWLFENGFMALNNPSRMEQGKLLSNVRWRQTRAYGMGINGLYINLKGREGKGVVREGRELNDLLDEITEKLLAAKDPQTGEAAVANLFRTSEVYHGEQAKHAPDIVVGYSRGYRCSDSSALGNFTRELFSPNLSKWSGDHCMSPETIPGVVISNRQLVLDDPCLSDFASTVLNLYNLGGQAPGTSRNLL